MIVNHTRVNKIISFLSTSDLHCKICFILTQKEKLESHEFDITEKTVKEFTNEFKIFFNKNKDKDEFEFFENDVAFGRVYYQRASDIAGYRDLLIEPAEKGINFNELKKTPIRTLIIIFKNKEGTELYIFRSMIKQKLLKRNNILRIFDVEQTLEIEDKDILIVDYIADCCLFEEEFIIFNVNPFEDIFDLRKKYERYSSEIFTYFKTKSDYKIKNISDIELHSKNSRMLRKLVSIYKNEIYNQFDFQEIKSYLKNREISVEIDSKNKEIYFKELDDFFDFFNDDILDSSFFDGTKYTIDSKRNRSGIISKRNKIIRTKQ